MDDKHELAKQDYVNGMKYKDIADKYEVSINTVKSWKKRHDWQRGEVQPKEKQVHTKTKKGAPPIVDELVNNDELTDKQKQFCLYYLQRFNATWAYMKAYEVDYQTANRAGPRLLVNVGIKEQLSKLKEELANDLYLSVGDVIKEYARQAFADIGDYVDFGSWPEKLTERNKKSVTETDKDGNKSVMEVISDDPILDNDGNEVIIHNSYTYFKDKSEVDTSLIKSIRMGKDGPVVELYDKQKAMQQLLELLPEQKNKNVGGDSFLQAIEEGVKALKEQEVDDNGGI